jgi:hypothetical protein
MLWCAHHVRNPAAASSVQAAFAQDVAALSAHAALIEHLLCLASAADCRKRNRVVLGRVLPGPDARPAARVRHLPRRPVQHLLPGERVRTRTARCAPHPLHTMPLCAHWTGFLRLVSSVARLTVDI